VVTRVVYRERDRGLAHGGGPTVRVGGAPLGIIDIDVGLRLALPSAPSRALRNRGWNPTTAPSHGYVIADIPACYIRACVYNFVSHDACVFAMPQCAAFLCIVGISNFNLRARYCAQKIMTQQTFAVNCQQCHVTSERHVPAAV
jgi:hypothetical protein